MKYYLLETDKVNYIIEKELFNILVKHGMMLSCCTSFSFVIPIGWHRGNDGKIYERYCFDKNNYKKEYKYTKFNNRLAKNYNKSIDNGVASNSNLNSTINYARSGGGVSNKDAVKSFLYRNKINKVSVYTGAEMARNNSYEM